MSTKAVAEKRTQKPDEWDINNWVDTIINAEKIKRDPAKMKYVKAEVKKRREALNKIK